MQKNRYTKTNEIMINHIVLTTNDGMKVPCNFLIPDNHEGVVIVLHGFGSSKESVTGQLLLDMLPASGLGVITFDFPGHGNEEAKQETLRIKNCLAYLKCVENYVSMEHPGTDILYFGSSFGAYITLLHICDGDFVGRKAFFRSAAVNMHELFDENLADDDFKDELARNGYVMLDEDYPNPVKIPAAFFKDLKGNDLFHVFSPEKAASLPIRMVHGEKDETIDLEKAREFSEKFGIPVRVFAGEDHTLSTHKETPLQVAEDAVRFYTG